MDEDGKTNLLEDPFCIYPFTSLNVTPSGQVKPCCVFSGTVERDGRPMSIYEHSVNDIWESQFMRDLRRDLVAGKHVKGCGYCYKQEGAGITSMGTHNNRWWARENPGATKEQWAQDNFAVARGVESLDLNVGNLCNLKCRMCNGSFSSGIAKDPVHSRWAPPGPVAARWQGDSSLVAPGIVLGVTYDGLGHPNREDGFLRSWIEQRASIKASISGIGVSGFSLRVFAPSETEIAVSANGALVLQSEVSGVLERKFDIPDLTSSDLLDIEIKSTNRIAVEEVRLRRNTRGNSGMLFSRLPGGEQWFQSEEFIKDELLSHPEQLRTLRLIGGEPLLIKEVRALLRHLIDIGVSENITLGITTNGTQADEDWFYLFSHFKLAHLAVSLDGMGQVNDYIRYPSKWAEIDANVRAMIGRPKVFIRVNMTVQAYNVLHVTDLVRYCEEREIQFDYHLLQHPPYLSVKAVPDAVRNLAVKRLREFVPAHAPSSRPWDYSASLETLARAIETQIYNRDDHNTLLKFTSEMDAARSQSLAGSLPELWEMTNNVEQEAQAETKPPATGAKSLFNRLISVVR